MIQSDQIQQPKALQLRSAKRPVPVNIEGAVGELLAGKFADLRIRNDNLERRINEWTVLLTQIAENTKCTIRTYTEDDFTEMFGVKKRTQLNYRKAGKLHYMKPGEKIIYTQQDIDDFIQRFDSLNFKI